MGELANISDQFNGLPFADLIASPLLSACEAQVKLAKSTAEFIDTIGLRKDGESKIARTVDFSATRPCTSSDGKITQEKVDLSIPMLAIVSTPNLLIENVKINFEMEVRSAFSEKLKLDAEAGMEGGAQVGWGPISASIKIHGSVAAHKENSRTSDNSAKYSIEVVAKQAGTPEGLMRVLDMLAGACEPRKITSAA